MEKIKEEEKTNNKKDYKKSKRITLAICLAAVLAVGGAFLKSSPHFINDSMDDVINDNKATTLFDDILELDETVGVTNIDTGEIEQVQVEDAIRMLEEKTNTIEYIRRMNINGSSLNELPDELKQSTIDFYNENGIETIAELYNDKNNNTIEKVRIAQQLLYIEKYDLYWLQENGIPLSNSILTRVLSAGTIQAYGTFEPVDYRVCEFDLEKKGSLKEVVIADPISGAKDKILLTPVLADEYNEAYNELQIINAKTEYTDDEILNAVNDTLNLSKRCINKELVKGNVFTYTKNTSQPENI